MVIQGTVPAGQKNVVRTANIIHPASFARAALIQALQQQGVKVSASAEKANPTSFPAYAGKEPIAAWVSPPLWQYGKLILKVSHNLGANLVPLLLAVKNGQKTFDEGMLLVGDFIKKEVKISENAFVFIDGAGGNENRLTPKDEIALLEYMYKKGNP